MTSTPKRVDRPTRRQLAYLRSLATRTGQTFAYPHTRREASREIQRLNRRSRARATERSIERKDIADAIARGPEDAAAVRPDEVAGFGSTATWSGALMTTPTVTELVRNGNRVGKRVELARYTIPAGERVLYGQRINGVVRFLPGNPVVLVGSLDPTEDSTCRSRTMIRAEGGTDAARRKRPNGASEPRCLSLVSGRTGHERDLGRKARSHRRSGGAGEVLRGRRRSGDIWPAG